MEKELAKLDEIALKMTELISLFSELSIDIKTIKSKGERHPIDANAVAMMLSKSRKMVYHLVAANAIPHHKRGGRIFFFEDEITIWLEDNQAFKNRNLKFWTSELYLQKKFGSPIKIWQLKISFVYLRTEK